jgi:hypothetical protein
MSSRWIVALTLTGALAVGARAFGQVHIVPGPFVMPHGVPTCSRDTRDAAQSRRDAFEAVRQINNAAQSFHRYQKVYPTWQELGATNPGKVPGSGVIVAWGAEEPVAGWRIHYISDEQSYVFTLTGTNDVCGAVFVSDDTARVIAGHDTGYHAGVVPLSTH